jgi:hypothetical protein
MTDTISGASSTPSLGEDRVSGANRIYEAHESPIGIPCAVVAIRQDQLPNWTVTIPLD